MTITAGSPQNLLQQYGKGSRVADVGLRIPDAYLFFFRVINSYLCRRKTLGGFLTERGSGCP
jgi:hypothetical protein